MKAKGARGSSPLLSCHEAFLPAHDAPTEKLDRMLNTTPTPLLRCILDNLPRPWREGSADSGCEAGTRTRSPPNGAPSSQSPPSHRRNGDEHRGSLGLHGRQRAATIATHHSGLVPLAHTFGRGGSSPSTLGTTSASVAEPCAAVSVNEVEACNEKCKDGKALRSDAAQSPTVIECELHVEATKAHTEATHKGPRSHHGCSRHASVKQSSLRQPNEAEGGHSGHHVTFFLGGLGTKPHLRDARARSASLPPSYRLRMGLPTIPEEEEEEMPVIRHGRPRAYTTIATRPTLQGITC